jgi:hypothetical protein
MKAVAKLSNPESAELTVAITLPIAEWHRFCNAINDSALRSFYPLWPIVQAVRKAVLAVTEKAESPIEYEH